MNQERKRLLLGLLQIITISSYGAQAAQIEVENGKIHGAEELSYEGRTYFAFKKIPFAAPPVGDLRFAYPLPSSDWSGVLDARSAGEHCAQSALGFKDGDEDCLHINVFTPMLPDENEENAGLPVLVWLHGGAFVSSGAKDYSPHLIMDRNLVLVIPQYRLGVLGFYSSNSQFAAGNYGLLDQVLALKWVQKNIRRFGGDPNRVTLGGDCAGGISSLLHMMSPLSEGLFHRVMSLSGSPLSTWAIHPSHNRFGLYMCNNLNCPPHDFKEMVQCFKDLPLHKLMITQRNIIEARDILVGNNKLGPAIQKPEHVHISTLFLEEHPLRLLLQKKYAKVPVLLSVTRDIGSYLVDMAMYDAVVGRLEEDPRFLEKFTNYLVKELDVRDHEAEHPKFKQYYLPDWNYENFNDAIPGFSKMVGDTQFNAAIIALAKILSKDVETRLLRFDYEGGPKLYDQRHEIRTTPAPPIPPTAVSHGDELYFLFPQERTNLTKEHQEIVTKMLNIVDDFVYGREPLKEWPVFTAKGLETTVITSTGDLERGVRFTSEEHEKFLHYITKVQNIKLFELIEKENQIDVTYWKHDEL